MDWEVDRSKKKVLAVKVLNLLRVRGETNQKTIAQNLNLHQSTLGTLLNRLEAHNCIKRKRGAKKELIVSLTQHQNTYQTESQSSTKRMAKQPENAEFDNQKQQNGL